VVNQVGFVELNEFVGCSPDGLIGDDGLIEIKCPNTATHIEYIIDGELPKEYEKQVHSQLWITDRKWCDFVSYDPRLTDRPIWIKRVERKSGIEFDIVEAVNNFIEEMQKLEQQIKGVK
jgi:hypothetical protein